jgi:toxin ParE1/3/4
MRRYPVIFRQAARDDLGAIFRYVLGESRRGETAKGYVKRIRNRCAKIADTPFGGIARDDLGAGIRMAVFERSVVILYLVQDETVWITNVFAGGRDYATLLGGQSLHINDN